MSGDCEGQGASPVDEWLSAAQLATELGVTEATITSWIAQGKDIPHLQLGPGQIRFRRSEITPLLKEHGAGAGRDGQ
ncbi:MAG: helix-turn-helix transcriptional regulator [Pseudonocardiaceae bacterium]